MPNRIEEALALLECVIERIHIEYEGQEVATDVLSAALATLTQQVEADKAALLAIDREATEYGATDTERVQAIQRILRNRLTPEERCPTTEVCAPMVRGRDEWGGTYLTTADDPNAILPTAEVCPVCHGSGDIGPLGTPIPCSACNGTGRTPEEA